MSRCPSANLYTKLFFLIELSFSRWFSKYIPKPLFFPRKWILYIIVLASRDTREPSASQSRYPIVHWCIKKGDHNGPPFFDHIFLKLKKLLAASSSFFLSFTQKIMGAPKATLPSTNRSRTGFQKMMHFHTNCSSTSENLSYFSAVYLYSYILLSWLYGDPKNRSREKIVYRNFRTTNDDDLKNLFLPYILKMTFHTWLAFIEALLKWHLALFL